MSRIGPGPSENARALGWPENCRYLDSSNLKNIELWKFWTIDPPRTPPSAILGSSPSLREWMLTLLILALPLVNIIMLFVWAFGGGTNPTKANYCKASLIWIAIVIVLYVCFFSLIMGLFAAIQ